MRQNDQQGKQALTPMQKQAILVCVVCALAILLTTGITLSLLKRGKPTQTPSQQPSSSESQPESTVEDISDHYQISETSSALLAQTVDAGSSYQDETLFLGDSNTVRLYANALISLQQFCAKEGIGTAAALNEKIVAFKNDDDLYTIAQAVAKMKPRRVVLTFGTNDTGMETEEFIQNYKALVQAIQESYPYTDIIVNTIPPIPADHANYPGMDQTKIDDFNMALLTMCEEMGIKFLNSAEALKDETGYGNADYYQTNDIHLKPAGLKVMLSYLRTHAYETQDRRPDTANIPKRASYNSNPSSAVQAPSSSQEQKVNYQVSYRVDKTGGGTLESGDAEGKALLNFNVTDPTKPITVTAVPDEGYVFVKWSDGVTDMTRIDVDLQQNLDVTAVFAQGSIQISSSGKALIGDYYTFKANLKGKYLETKSIRWYANGVEVEQAAGKATVKVEIDSSMGGETFHIYATASYNGYTVTSNTLEVTVSGEAASSSASSGSASSSESAASSDSSSSSNSSSNSGSSSSAASGSAASSSSSASSGASSGSTSASSKTEASSSSSSSSAASSKVDGSSSSSKVDDSSSAAASSKADSSSASASSQTGSSTASSSASTSASSAASSGSVAASGAGSTASNASSKPSSSQSSSASSAGSAASGSTSGKTEEGASRQNTSA